MKIAKKHEEKLLMLGPVIERIQSESHDPTIERTFQIAERFNLLPPPPPELEGVDLGIEYISILAQAQKMVGTTAIEQTTSFIGNLSSIVPEALDKLDTDEVVEAYANLTGAPPRIIRSKEDVAQIRQMRAQQQAAQAQAERGQATIDNAKTMSETKLNEESALDQLLGGIA
jgi:hypothetical protein